MEDKLLKRRHRDIDYLRIIKVLGLLGEFVDYFYKEHVRLISPRRQARYFLMSKKVDVYSTDILIKQNDITDYGHLFKFLNGNIKECYL